MSWEIGSRFVIANVGYCIHEQYLPNLYTWYSGSAQTDARFTSQQLDLFYDLGWFKAPGDDRVPN